jgi:hypothetical protein
MIPLAPIPASRQALPGLLPAAPWQLWTACLAVVAIGVAAQFYYMPHHDMAWLLYSADRVMQGDQLYGSLFEVNPPLIVVISTLGVSIASGLEVTRSHGWVVFVATQIVLSLWLTARLLRRSLQDEAGDLYGPLLALLAWTYACLPGREYGQREHIMVLWFTPYVVAAVNRARGQTVGWPTALTLGLLVGLAVCLKPYYAVLIALIELIAVAWPARSIRPWFRAELLTAVALGIAYVAFVRVEHPLFFTAVLPVAVQYYGAYGSTIIETIGKPVHLVYGAAGAVALWFTRTPPIAARLSQAFAVAGLGAYITLAVQSKGWSYHFLPTKSFLTMTIGLAALVFLRERLPLGVARRLQASPSLVSAVAVTALLAGSAGWSVQQALKHRAGRDYRLVHEFEAFFDSQRRPADSLVLLSPSMFPGFPLVETRRARWGIRYNHLWMLPGLLEEEHTRPNAPDRVLTVGRLSSTLAEDIDASRPQYVIVERQAKMPGGRLEDVLGLFLQSDRFRQTWRAYTLARRIGGFEIYQRVGAPAAAARGGL